LLGISAGSALSGSFEAVLGTQQFKRFQAQAVSGQPFANATLLLKPKGGEIPMQCAARRQDGMLIVELGLQQGAHSLGPLDLEDHIRLPLSRMETALALADTSDVAAGEIRRISGYDRVMIYRFDERWNGEVTPKPLYHRPLRTLG
jgi:light-regulated signal transduction histidine kinase (bacteriophytochrome)